MEPSTRSGIGRASIAVPPDGFLPAQAWLFAARAHRGQLYPGTALPYLTHIGMVLLNLTSALEREPSLDGTLAKCCAILHDTVEDTATTLAGIAALFGERVAEGVSALTKNKALGAQAMDDSLVRIRVQPREVWLVKLADRIANLDTPPACWTAAKCRAYADEGETILKALGEASPLLAARLEAWYRKVIGNRFYDTTSIARWPAWGTVVRLGRVIHGGSGNRAAANSRAASSNLCGPYLRTDFLGFRRAFSPGQRARGSGNRRIFRGAEGGKRYAMSRSASAERWLTAIHRIRGSIWGQSLFIP
jgi:hypothetical protein